MLTRFAPLLFASTLLICSAAGLHAEDGGGFTDEELSVARFWADMGPTLRDHGIEAYARRYHENFRHWDLAGSGSMATKASAIRLWSQFHTDGHRITCTHVEPVTIDIVGGTATARLVYEQTNTMADGEVTTGIWRMVSIFQRSGDSWQVLESNMVDVADQLPNSHCP